MVGASSLETDPYQDRYDAWERLPLFREPDFCEALDGLVRRHGVDQLFTSHAPTYNFFRANPHVLPAGLVMLGPSPHARQTEIVRQAWRDVAAKIAEIDRLAGKHALYAPAFVAGALHHAAGLYGECREEKALALFAVLADCPPGDVVEIGSFFGKSAYLLDRIARARGLGPTLAVDPWNLDASVQTDSPADIQALAGEWDWDVVFQGFLLTMGAVGFGGGFNYLRLPSAKAWAVYDAGRPVRSPEFGITPMSGRIGLLHIDGNHDEASVREDFRLWSQRLADGGWVVFDDYEWSHGDGPCLVAAEAEAAYGGRVVRRFVRGGALFLKIDADR